MLMCLHTSLHCIAIFFYKFSLMIFHFKSKSAFIFVFEQLGVKLFLSSSSWHNSPSFYPAVSVTSHIPSSEHELKHSLNSFNHKGVSTFNFELITCISIMFVSIIISMFRYFLTLVKSLIAGEPACKVL